MGTSRWPLMKLKNGHRWLTHHSRSAFRMFSTTSPRNPFLAKWDATDMEYFQQLLTPANVLTSREDTATNTVDWLKNYNADAKYAPLVLKPSITDHVADILRYCHQRNLAVVPQGGNTGLVGGSVPVYDEIVLSTSNLNRVLEFDEVSGVLVCEAGCILEELDDYVGKFGYMMPLDLGAKGSCQIGGNLSTNAGGLRLVRYGSLRGNVLGVEAVLADGSTIDCLSTMRKDNTGYDLKQLFIGAEGTLGIITKVAISTPPRSLSVNTAFLGCESFEAVQHTFIDAKKHLGEVLSAVEFLDRQSLELVLMQHAWTQDPLPVSPCPFYLVIETSGSNVAHDRKKLEVFLEHAMNQETIIDGIVAQDHTQARKLFSIREEIPLALAARGCVYKYDISLPMSHYYAIVEETRAQLAPYGAMVIGYGHLGDSNVHLNVSTLQFDEHVMNALEPFVFEWTSQFGGSISAEHGVGVHKPSYLHLSKSANAINLMKQIKQLMDPKGILNPYKVLPQH